MMLRSWVVVRSMMEPNSLSNATDSSNSSDIGGRTGRLELAGLGSGDEER